MDGSSFNPDMFTNFDFNNTQFSTTEAEENVLRGIDPNAPSDQAADGSLSDLDTPAQYLDGVAAPPSTPFIDQYHSATCIWCDAPSDAHHAPDCVLNMSPGAGPACEAEMQIDPLLLPPQAAPSIPELDIGPPAQVIPATPALTVNSYYQLPTPVVASSPSPYPMPMTMPVSLPMSPTASSKRSARKLLAQAQAPPSPPEDEAPLEYRGIFCSFDAARQALIPPQGADRLVRLQLPNDDWQQVKTHHVHAYAARVFNALHAEPGPPPHNFTDEHTDYYYEHSDNVRNTIVNKIDASPDKAEARAMLLVEEVINVHELGVPVSVWERKEVKAGYLLESGLTCSARLEAVINDVDNDKYVAMDVLSGNGLADLARSPARYMRRKHENCRVNARKAEEKRKAEEAKKGDQPQFKTPAAPASRTAKKTPRSKTAASTHASGFSPKTPTPSVPAGLFTFSQGGQADEGAQSGHKRRAEHVHEKVKRLRWQDPEE